MLEHILGRLVDLEEWSTVETVFGDTVGEHGRTIIPVVRVAYGFGLGGGRQAEPAGAASEPLERRVGGGGGGVRIAPVALVEMT